jgi:hypothetical protein
LDSQKNSKTKEEKAFFIIFVPSYRELSFWGPKKEFLNRAKQYFFCKWVDMGVKNPYFYNDFKMGHFSFESSSNKSYGPKKQSL